MHTRIDAAIAGIADHQCGLITAAQLREIGVGGQSVQNRLSARLLHRIYRGVYAVGHRDLSLDQRWRAAILAAGSGAALSHISAAHVYRIWRGPGSGIHVVAPTQRRSPVGVHIHFSRQLERRDTTIRRGLPVTSVARTLVDLADVLELHELVNVMHEAAYRNLLDISRTRAVIEQLHGRSRLAIAKEALELHVGGSAGTRSQLEDKFLRLVGASDLPVPQTNVRIRSGARRIEVDALWRECKLCVEVDGPGHRRPRTLVQDVEHDRLLRQEGYEVVRITRSDIEDMGDALLAALRAHLNARRP